MLTVKQRLYLTADGKRLVPEGDPKAATLYAAPGDEISDEAAERFGVKKLEADAEKKAAK